jgi:hypothetical protein
MTITMLTRIPCHLCGYQTHCLKVVTARVNKNSIRTWNGVGARDRTCNECREPQFMAAWTRWWLDDESQAKVDAYREKRGWS